MSKSYHTFICLNLVSGKKFSGGKKYQTCFFHLTKVHGDVKWFSIVVKSDLCDVVIGYQVSQMMCTFMSVSIERFMPHPLHSVCSIWFGTWLTWFNLTSLCEVRSVLKFFLNYSHPLTFHKLLLRYIIWRWCSEYNLNLEHKKK